MLIEIYIIFWGEFDLDLWDLEYRISIVKLTGKGGNFTKPTSPNNQPSQINPNINTPTTVQSLEPPILTTIIKPIEEQANYPIPTTTNSYSNPTATPPIT